MTATEQYINIKTKYTKYVVMMQMGNFYECLDTDAEILSLLMNYKIKTFGEHKRVGFPIASSKKVINELNKEKINHIIIDNKNGKKEITMKKKYLNNHYEDYYKNLHTLVNINNRINKINERLHEKIAHKEIISVLEQIEKLI